MSELKKGELLDIFDGVFSFYLGELGHEEDKVKIEQAKKQIAALIQKPQVTEEWIQRKAEDTANDYPDVAFPNLITIFKKLLKEAGVHV